MFSSACEEASKFTAPLISSVRKIDGEVKCSCCAYIILNDEGWIATVAHSFNPFIVKKQHESEILNYYKQVDCINQNTTLREKIKRNKISKLNKNRDWITNHSFWWGFNNVQLLDIKALPEADLVIGRLDPFDPKWFKGYPVLKDPKELKHGTSLCKLGYPFHNVNATYDDQTQLFNLAPGTLPLPLFPLEGIYTRNQLAGKSKDGKYDIKFLETSSPGLRGQSGGPIFDSKGTVWAIQSRTDSLDLGFSPKIKRGEKEIEENQILNIGYGVHSEVITNFLNDNGIKYQKSTY